ncbi:MAG TPA: TetR/AcrR family transcriptional regulator [Nocardioides sp.]|jgi:AcrR family transcriptional regulator|uniref:TetR/AcrR family transcriptional regulator n=1 Tax=Nocardioides sp. TaxID=35761 RepID=UPI002E344F6B|nr:TetR/AcrR family transcriptional regulator [Nocardioides sp.]HEX3930263.1 TetR/AcrR family transcriptional regulator [Nocardioides sp.]
MSSLRHNAVAQSAYLDAARACILDVGWRRTTLTEVARRAGVSRMTIYRAWPDMPAVLGDLMTREWGEVVARAVAGTDAALGESADAAARIVAQVVATTRALRDNELFVRIVELDPQLLLPYLLTRRGRSQEAVAALTAERLREGQQDGSVRDGDPVAMARALLLATHGFVLSAHTMVDDSVSEADLDHELEHLVRSVVSP